MSSASSGRRDEGIGQESSPARPAAPDPQNSFSDSGGLGLDDGAQRQPVPQSKNEVATNEFASSSGDEETETDICATVLSSLRVLEPQPFLGEEFLPALRTLCRDHDKRVEAYLSDTVEATGIRPMAKTSIPKPKAVEVQPPTDPTFWRFSGAYNLDLSSNGFEKFSESMAGRSGGSNSKKGTELNTP